MYEALLQVEQDLHAKNLVHGARDLDKYLSAELLLMDRSLKKENKELSAQAKDVSKESSKKIKSDSRKNKDLAKNLKSVSAYLSAAKRVSTQGIPEKGR